MASKVADLAGEMQAEQGDITTTHHKVPTHATANRPGEGGGTNAAVTAVVGMIIYNSTTGTLQQYNAQGWSSIDSPPTISSLDYPGSATAVDTVGTFSDATCDYNNDPTIAHDTNTKMRKGMTVTGTGIPAAATIASVTSTTAFELSASTTGGAVTNGTLTFNAEILIVAGTNFQVGATVLIDGSAPSTVTRDSSSQITLTGMPAKSAQTFADGLVVTNPTGLSASINIDYSADPQWTTASGNVLDDFNTVISTIDLAATSATSYAITTGALPTGLSMSTSTGDITGTMNASAATYNFTVTATDAEVQTAIRSFNIISKGSYPSGGIEGGNLSPTDAFSHYTYNSITYRVHKFTSGTSNFVLPADRDVDILLVGGGGSGGSQHAGGGGAGALVWAPSYNSGVLAAGTYAVVIGPGGGTVTGANGDSPGNKGTDTTFGSLTALTAEGGGLGGGYRPAASNPWHLGGAGGSGGGTGNSGSSSPQPGGTGSGTLGGGGAAIKIFGGDGGVNDTNSSNRGSGGGGAGANGAIGGAVGGNGGVGESDFLTDATTTSNFLYYARAGTNASNAAQVEAGGVPGTSYIAGGGAGGAHTGTLGTGGTGGGGNAIDGTGISGLVNTGSGGGSNRSNIQASGAGGSGVVIIRYVI